MILNLLLVLMAQAATDVDFPIYAQKDREVISAAALRAKSSSPLALPNSFSVHEGETPDSAEARFMEMEEEFVEWQKNHSGFSGYQITLGNYPTELDSVGQSTCYRGDSRKVIQVIQTLWGFRFSSVYFLWGTRAKNFQWLDPFVIESPDFSMQYLPAAWSAYKEESTSVLLVGSKNLQWRQAFAWSIGHCK